MKPPPANLEWSALFFGLLSPFFPYGGQGRISPRNLLKLQVNISTQNLYLSLMCWEMILELCQTYTRCFMHAYLILQYVSKIILA